MPFNANAAPLPSAPRAPTAPEVTTLPNGVRVVSSENYSALTGFGIYVNVGTKHESAENQGSCYFLQQFAVKDNEDLSAFGLVRTMSENGCDFTASSSRESVVYTGEGIRESAPFLIRTMFSAVFRNKFDDWQLTEIKETLHKKDHDDHGHQGAAASDPDILEAIHAAAFPGQALGQPLHPSKGQDFSHITEASLRSFLATHFVPSRIVLSGTGINHQDLVSLVTPLFGSLKASSNPPQLDAPAYTGGDWRSHEPRQDGLTHVALAFQAPSLKSKDLAALCVLQTLMGGGSSFSAGGPGKGMYTRLFRQVLNKHEWIQDSHAFTSLFEDTSLFGIYGTTFPAYAGELVRILAEQAQGMAGTVAAADLDRAKAGLKSALLMQLESRGVQLDDLGRQLSIYGALETPQQVCAKVDAVTAEDIVRVARELIKSPVSVAASGDLTTVPRYEDIAKHLKQ